mgnify:CR=1 FL=1
MNITCYSILNSKNIKCRCNKKIFIGNWCKYHSERKKKIYYNLDINNTNLNNTNLNDTNLNNDPNNTNLNDNNLNNKNNLKKIIYIQKLFRTNLLNQCVNIEDFYTLEHITDIPAKYRFILNDNNHRYCFDIRSLNEYINNNNRILNPYTNTKINDNNLNKIKSKILLYKNDINFNIKKDILTKEQVYNQLVLSTFQKFETLHFIMDIRWFTKLNLYKLKELYKVCEDIWNYRAQLTHEQKLQIVHDGKLFTTPVSIIKKFNNSKLSYLKHLILDNFNKSVTQGKTDNDKKLGAMLMLTGFAKVSSDVLNAYPWLYQN